MKITEEQQEIGDALFKKLNNLVQDKELIMQNLDQIDDLISDVLDFLKECNNENSN